MVEISLVKYGTIPSSMLDKISGLMEESYSILGEPMGGSVDLEVFEKSEEETFFAMHDAFRGKPRIRIYLDKLQELPEPVGLAGIRRQIAHSILHGSLKFYLVKFPQDLIRAINQFNLPYEFGNSLLYSIGMAAKEYGVTELLTRKGFVKDQVAYAEYILEPTAEELLAWEIALRNKLEKILHLAAIIRDISCAVPLIDNEMFGNKIKAGIKGKLAHLNPDYQASIQRIIEKFPLLGTDMFVNIELITKWFTEEILTYEFCSFPPGSS